MKYVLGKDLLMREDFIPRGAILAPRPVAAKVVTRSAEFSFLLYPIVWLIGADQFIWYLIFLPVVAGIAAGLIRPRKEMAVFCAGAGLFMLAVLLSATSVTLAPGDRWITYGRDLMTYMAIFAIVVWSADSRRGWPALEPILKAVIFAVGVAAIIGDLTWLMHPSLHFQAPLERFFPGALTSTDLGQAMFSKSLTPWGTWLYGVNIPRAHSLFLYPNTYAAAVELVAPFALFYALTRRDWSRLYYTALFIAMILALITTTSRSGMVAALLGALLLISLIVARYTSRKTMIVFFLLEGACAVVVLLALAALYSTEIKAAAESLMYARGGGSLDTRSAIYTESLRWAINNPIGYGVNRDVPGIIPPLGSHSQYVGVLFKYGFLGVVAWLIMMCSVGGRIYRGLRFGTKWRRNADWWFHACAAMSFFTIIVHQFTLDLTLDLPVAIIFGLILGAVVARQPAICFSATAFRVEQSSSGKVHSTRPRQPPLYERAKHDASR